MSIRVRRGTDTQRLSVILEEGEIAYTTDTKKFYVGDGITLGGTEIGGGTVASVTASSPLSSSGGANPNITIQDALADGSTKGAASFNASDFNASSGVISIDYTNGQSASGISKGFLTSADWTAFNNKLDPFPVGNFAELTSSVLNITGGSSSIIGAGITVEVKQSSATQGGYLSSADWSTFNSKGNGTVTSVGLTTGTTGTDVNVSGSPVTGSGSITLNIPDASATARGVITTGTQTLAGSKTFSSAPTFSTMTAGSVLFAGTSGLLSQDNTKLFWDNTNKRLGIGTSSPVVDLHIVGAFAHERFANSPQFNFRRSNGTQASPTGVLSLEDLGAFNFVGLTSSLTYGATSSKIGATSTENFTSTAQGSLLYFEVTPNGSTTRTRPLQINQTGNIQIGTTTDAGYKLDVRGTITASSALAQLVNFEPTLTASANNDFLVATNVNATFSLGAFTGTSSYLQRWQNAGTTRSFINSLGSQTWNLNNTIVETGRIEYSTPSGNTGMAIWDWDTTTSTYFNRYTIANQGTYFYQGFHNINVLGGMALFNTSHNLVLGYTGTPIDAGYKLDVNGTTRSVTSIESPIVRGNTTASGSLTLSSTSNATKGNIIFGASAYDEVNNRLGIGTSSPESMLHNISNSSGITTSDSPENLRIDRYTANSPATAPLVILRKARGTFSSPSAVASGDTIGVFGFRGHNGTAMTTGSRAYLIAYASENWTTTANGTYLAYGTTANGTTTGTERLRIDQDGSVLIGTTTNAGYKLDVNGTTRSVTSIESPIVRGNTTASGTLTLSSTSNATKGNIIFGTNSVYDEVNDRIGIGTTTPTGTVQATGTAAGAFYGQRYTNSSGSANCTLGKARGTVSSPLIVQNADTTGGFVFEGYDGASFLGTANITGIVDGTPSSGVMPQALRCVTGTTLANRTERFRIASDGLFTFWDGGNFVLGTTTGTKIGTATSQKIGFWNATPIVQPTTAVAGATRVGGAGTTVTDTDTFDGYTIAQIVKALRNAGLLA